MESFDIPHDLDLQQAWAPLVSRLCDRLSCGVVLLEGDLGAGKTTFVQVLAKKLGFTGSVLSPTYGLMSHYPSIHLLHLDLYRIQDSREILGLSLEDYAEDLIVIEWGEAYQEMFSDRKAIVRISLESCGLKRKALVEWI